MLSQAAIFHIKYQSAGYLSIVEVINDIVFLERHAA